VNGKRFDVELAAHDAPPTDLGGTGDTAPAPSPGRPSRETDVDDGASSSEVGDGGETIDAEMQGTILSVEVAEGDTVAAGDVVCVLEAMKMENDVVADRGGTVAGVHVAVGDSVDMDEVLVVLE